MKLPKEFTLQEIAYVAGGRVVGPADTKVASVAVSPMQAQPGDLAFVFEAKLVAKLGECKATAVMVPEGVETKIPAIVVDRPLLAVQRMLSAVQPKRFHPTAGVHPTAFVDPTATLAEGVAVGPKAVVGAHTKIGARTVIGAGCLIGGGVEIGEDCLFHQGALVADQVKIGNRVILQQGAGIGADGFGYVTERPSNMERRVAGNKELSDEPNPLLKIPQIGTVVLEDDVEVGSFSTIDRATMGATVVGAGSKIDNLVMVAHNCKIGREVIIVGSTAVGGSCTLGDRAILAGQVALKDHLHIGKDAILQGRSGAMNDIDEGAVVVGVPAIPMREYMQQLAYFKKLGKMNSDIRDMKKKMEEMEAALAAARLERV